MEDFSFWASISLSIQNMLLAIQCLGLGSVVFTDIYPEKLKKILNVPDPLKVICLLPIGFPAESPSRDCVEHWMTLFIPTVTILER